MTKFVPDPDITRIVRDLNLTARGDVPREKGPSESGDLERLLAWAAERGASDLFLVSGSEPTVKSGSPATPWAPAPRFIPIS